MISTQIGKTKKVLDFSWSTYCNSKECRNNRRKTKDSHSYGLDEAFLILDESRPSQAWLLHLTVKLAWLIVSYNRREGPHNFLIHI